VYNILRPTVDPPASSDALAQEMDDDEAFMIQSPADDTTAASPAETSEKQADGTLRRPGILSAADFSAPWHFECLKELQALEP
jgi:hypothetical protein